uniref:Uncharacterized protein n=1 Tax=Aceria tosichella TaxID=561515 RepID=A0A6G1SAU7_9ACAR
MDKCDTVEAVDNQSAASQQNPSQGEQYWKMRYEKLKEDFDHLQKVNQNLEEKLLNVVETSERRHEALLASVEYEKKTLMADVNKLSTKLVDARIKLHDLIEEKEQSSTNPYMNKIDPQQAQQMADDPNLV